MHTKKSLMLFFILFTAAVQAAENQDNQQYATTNLQKAGVFFQSSVVSFGQLGLLLISAGFGMAAQYEFYQKRDLLNAFRDFCVCGLMFRYAVDLEKEKNKNLAFLEDKTTRDRFYNWSLVTGAAGMGACVYYLNNRYLELLLPDTFIEQFINGF